MASLLIGLMVFIALPASADLSPINQRVTELLSNMTVEEKIAQLFYGGAPSDNVTELLKLMPYGIGSLQLTSIAERNAIQSAFMSSTRLAIPISFYGETLRSGAAENVTIFPTPSLLGCSWNTSLAEAVGRAVAVEAWSNGVDRSFSPVLQVPYLPIQPRNRRITLLFRHFLCALYPGYN